MNQTKLLFDMFGFVRHQNHIWAINFDICILSHVSVGFNSNNYYLNKTRQRNELCTVLFTRAVFSCVNKCASQTTVINTKNCQCQWVSPIQLNVESGDLHQSLFERPIAVKMGWSVGSSQRNRLDLILWESNKCDFFSILFIFNLFIINVIWTSISFLFFYKHQILAWK